MTAERRDLRDGQPPAYVFRSPCCGRAELVPAWIVGYALATRGGLLQLQCGRASADPLRAAGTGRGCGVRFEARCEP